MMKSKVGLVIFCLFTIFTCTNCDLADVGGWLGLVAPNYDYTITYHLKDGKNSPNNPSGFNSASTGAVTLYEPTREGYIFDQWFLDEDLTIAVTEIPYSTGENVEVYAKWDFIYALRDPGPAGGLIFYRDQFDEYPWNYLEAAPAGWSGETDDPGYIFGYYKEEPYMAAETVGTARAIGSGALTTSRLAAAMGTTAYRYYDNNLVTSSYAAKACADYAVTSGGITYDDWFLPSVEELWVMKRNLYAQQVGGFPTSYFGYWSSSEEYDSPPLPQIIACMLDLRDSAPTNLTKQELNRVRPIRAF